MKKLCVTLLLLMYTLYPVNAEANLQYDIYTNSNIWKLYSTNEDIGNFTKVAINQTQPIIEMNKVNGLEWKYDGSTITNTSNNIRFSFDTAAGVYYHTIDFKIHNKFVSNIALDMVTTYLDDSASYPTIMHITDNKLYTFTNPPISLNNDGSGKYTLLIKVDLIDDVITVNIYKNNELLLTTNSNLQNDIKKYQFRFRVRSAEQNVSLHMNVLNSSYFTQNDISNRFIDIKNGYFYNYCNNDILGIIASYDDLKLNNVEFSNYTPGSHSVTFDKNIKTLFWDLATLKPIAMIIN